MLGTPSLDEIQLMNQNYTEYKFPQVKPHPWSKARRAMPPHPLRARARSPHISERTSEHRAQVLRPRTPPDALDLVSKVCRRAA